MGKAGNSFLFKFLWLDFELLFLQKIEFRTLFWVLSLLCILCAFLHWPTAWNCKRFKVRCKTLSIVTGRLHHCIGLKGPAHPLKKRLTPYSLNKCQHGETSTWSEWPPVSWTDTWVDRLMGMTHSKRQVWGDTFSGHLPRFVLAWDIGGHEWAKWGRRNTYSQFQQICGRSSLRCSQGEKNIIINIKSHHVFRL